MTAKVKLHIYFFNFMENVSEPDIDISNSIDTAKELLLSKPQSSTTPDVKKSNKSKLVSYEMRFPDFYFSSVKNGCLCKTCCSFSHGNVGNRAFVDKPRKLGEHLLARFSDHLNSNRHKLSMENKQCFKEMHLMHLYSPVKLSVKIIIFEMLLQNNIFDDQTGHTVIILEIL